MLQRYNQFFAGWKRLAQLVGNAWRPDCKTTGQLSTKAKYRLASTCSAYGDAV